MRVVPLRRRDTNKLVRNFCSMFEGLCHLVRNAKKAVRFTVGNYDVIVINEKPLIIAMKDDYLIPTLIAVKIGGPNSIPFVEVDEGAVKHVINGANVMVPGIVNLAEFNEGDIVAVWGPGMKAAIAVGKALMSSDEIRRSSKGKAVKNMHHAGDKIWKACLEYIRTHQSR